MIKKLSFAFLISILFMTIVHALDQNQITVASDGSGDFTTIFAAIK